MNVGKLLEVVEVTLDEVPVTEDAPTEAAPAEEVVHV